MRRICSGIKITLKIMKLWSYEIQTERDAKQCKLICLLMTALIKMEEKDFASILIRSANRCIIKILMYYYIHIKLLLLIFKLHNYNLAIKKWIYLLTLFIDSNYKNFSHSTGYYKKIDVYTIYHFLTIFIIFLSYDLERIWLCYSI